MNRIVHFEIHADDLERAAKFYTDVFGWEIKKWDSPVMEYWMVMTAPMDSKEPGINGGMIKRPCAASNQGSNAFVCTIQVDDIDASLEKALANGGKLAMAKFDIGGMALQAYCIDTEGNTFGLHQVIPKSE